MILSEMRDFVITVGTVVTIIGAWSEVKKHQKERIHEKQLDALINLYVALEKLMDYSKLRTKKFILEGENHKAYPGLVRSSMEEAYNEFILSRLLLPPNVVDKVEVFFQKIGEMQIQLGSVQWFDDNEIHSSERAGYFQNAGKIAHSELPEILKSIEQQARAIIHGKCVLKILVERLKMMKGEGDKKEQILNL